MRRPLVSAAILIAFGIATPVLAEDQPAQQNAAPKAETGAPVTPPAEQNSQSGGQENRKTSGTNDQSGPSSAAPTASQDGQGDKATHSVSGRSGTEEPGSHAPSQQATKAGPVLVNGALNVPGAPADGQTVPAKFSQRNDAIDHLPIMGMSLGLSDDQKKAIVEAVKLANQPVAATKAGVAEELPWDLAVHDLPSSANDPALAKLKYVRAQDRILLVLSSNRIVVGEIKN